MATLILLLHKFIQKYFLNIYCVSGDEDKAVNGRIKLLIFVKLTWYFFIQMYYNCLNHHFFGLLDSSFLLL